MDIEMEIRNLLRICMFFENIATIENSQVHYKYDGACVNGRKKLCCFSGKRHNFFRISFHFFRSHLHHRMKEMRNGHYILTVIGKSPCASEPCQNSGRCTRQRAIWVCVCPADYTGKVCENSKWQTLVLCYNTIQKIWARNNAPSNELCVS